jgi:hypothetical protein
LVSAAGDQPVALHRVQDPAGGGTAGSERLADVPLADGPLVVDEDPQDLRFHRIQSVLGKMVVDRALHGPSQGEEHETNRMLCHDCSLPNNIEK